MGCKAMKPCTASAFVLLVGLSLSAVSTIARSEPGATTQPTTQAATGESLGIASVPNLRDLGGYKTSDGTTVARGLAYRSDQLSAISESDIAKLVDLNLKVDFDLRTAAALLTLLGVPEEKVMEDYLRSNDYILPAYKKTIDDFVAAGGEESIPLAILGVKKEYLHAAFEEMETKYGTIEEYFSEGLGIDAAKQKALRDLYLAPR